MNAGLEECRELRKDHVDISGQLSLQSRFGFFQVLTVSARGFEFHCDSVLPCVKVIWIDHKGLYDQEGVSLICLGLADSGFAQCRGLYRVYYRYAEAGIVQKCYKVLGVDSGGFETDQKVVLWEKK